MRRVIAPALLALFLVAGNTAQAGFGLLDRFCNRGCAPVACGEPACGCEIVEPACGCEVVDPCCSPRPKFGGMLKKLFSCHAAPCCEPVCGAEPSCGYEVIEPACGCEPACPAPCKPLFGGFLKKLMHKHSAGCGCAEPVCGCEPACGCGL